MHYKTLAILLSLWLAAMVLSGCSGIKPYKADLAKNLVVRTHTASGSFFTSIDARADIYDVDSACNIVYLGSVDLERPEIEIGLPSGEQSYLNFVFSTSGFLANNQGSTGFDAYLETRRNHMYYADVSYNDGIYDVILKEQKIGNRKLKELDYGSCRPK